MRVKVEQGCRELIGTLSKNTKWFLPTISEQEAIAEVLSSLDDKIDLLHRNNKTLEQLAETLFKQWFVVEQNENTQVLQIQDVAVVQNGFSFKSNEFTNEYTDSYEVFKMGHIDLNGGLRSTPKRDYVKRSDKLKKWVLKKRDLVLAMTDMKDNVVILGVPALIDKDDYYVLNQRVARIFLKDDSPLIDPLLLYYQMRDKNFILELQSKANSGVQVNLSTDSIKQSEIIVPNITKQQHILEQVSEMQNKLELNRRQIHNIEILRDTLLPKLMNGTVRVKDFAESRNNHLSEMLETAAAHVSNPENTYI